MSRSINVFAISGSLRKGSYNTATLRAARDIAPDGMTVTLGDLSEVPIYDDDLRSGGLPVAVASLCASIRDADAVLIATPEYNYSIPGMLKNAIDWISRATPAPFAGKPVSIIGAATGALGTARAQYDLRKVFVFLDAFVLNKPEIFISHAASRFDADLRLTDEPTRELIARHLAALQAWTLRLYP